MSYYESCLECNSLNVEVVSEEPGDDGIIEYYVLCRDCGADWYDWAPKGEDRKWNK